jgi:hypothetical protein
MLKAFLEGFSQIYTSWERVGYLSVKTAEEGIKTDLKSMAEDLNEIGKDFQKVLTAEVGENYGRKTDRAK